MANLQRSRRRRPETYGVVQWSADHEGTVGATQRNGPFTAGTLQQWDDNGVGNGLQSNCDAGSSVTVVTSPVRRGTYAQKHLLVGTLASGSSSNGIRAESSNDLTDSDGVSGHAWYYSFSMQIPAAGQAAFYGGSGSTALWCTCAQWSPNLGLAPYAATGISAPFGLYMDHGGTAGALRLYFAPTNSMFDATAGMVTGTTTLNGAITSGATTIVVNSASGFPSSGNQYLVQIDSEFLNITAGQGTTSWTVTRGVMGTTAAAHSSGAAVGTAFDNSYTLCDVPFDTWMDITLYVQWGPDLSTGQVGVWYNGRPVVPVTPMRTMYKTSDGCRGTLDMYRNDMLNTLSNTIYYDEYKRHSAFLPRNTP